MKLGYKIHAYKERDYKYFRETLKGVERLTNRWDKIDITIVSVVAASEEEAITKAKKYLERSYYDVVEVFEMYDKEPNLPNFIPNKNLPN